MKTATRWILRSDRLPSILTVASIATVVLIAAVWLLIWGGSSSSRADRPVRAVVLMVGAPMIAYGPSAGATPAIVHSRPAEGIGTLQAGNAADAILGLNFVQGKIAFEFAGQVTNFAPTPEAPLGSSNQYGYLTTVRGIDNLFSGSPHNEATAVLTFFNEATTTGSFSDGPLRINDREGTTTIYLNSVPASFANPDSFRSGIPVQTSTLHQQAIVDPVAGTFTAVFANAISSTSTFTINGTTLTLGQKGQAFRAAVTGHVNALPPPNGQFAGYAVGVGEE